MRRLVGHCALCLLLATSAAAAAPGDSRAEAKASFAEGQRSFEQKDYQTALRHFRRAFELHAHDAVRFNIAVCLEKLGRHRDALLEYEAAIKSDQLNAEQRQRAERQAAAAREELGSLVVRGTPEGADVLVDGEQLCNLPCTVELDAGKHEILVRAGKANEQRSVMVRKRDKAFVNVELGGVTASAAEPSGETPSAPEVVSTPQPDAPRDGESRGPSWITWAGAGLVVIGGAGIAIFGPQAQSAHDEFTQTGSEDARDDGVRARNLTNASIGVAVVGAIAIGIDLLVFARQPEQSSSARRQPFVLRF